MSEEPERAQRPSGVIATVVTKLVWPSRVRSVWPVSKSQTRRVLSQEPETTRRPSCDSATAVTALL
jgi:hypothetical protein